MRNQRPGVVGYLDVNRLASEPPVIRTAEQFMVELAQERDKLHALVARAARIIDDATGEVLQDQDWHSVAWQWQKDAGVLPWTK